MKILYGDYLNKGKNNNYILIKFEIFNFLFNVCKIIKSKFK